MPHSATAPGKIILSGEYAMGLIGARGIAMPSPFTLTATFEEDTEKDSLFIDWPGIDDMWKAYIGRIVAECGLAKGDAFCGRLTIENRIPLGKGMGSSTALVIAVCKALLGDRSKASALRIEDRVNPGHSGMDFTVIWLNRAVVFQKGQKPKKPRTPIKFPHATFIDTGAPGETTPELVAWVKERYTKGDSHIAAALSSIGACTERLIEGESPFSVFPDHHKAQIELGVVTPEVQKLIKEIEESGGAAKVIGAGGKSGGSGIVLAIHHSMGDLHACIPGTFKVLPTRG